MVQTLTRRLVVGLIAVLIDLQAESQRRSSDSVTCDGEKMSPGDVCMAFGKGAAGRGGTYEEMKAKQVAAVQPDKLRTDDLIWRFVAIVPLLISAALFISVIAMFIAVARAPAGRRSLAAANGWDYVRKHPTLAGEAGLFKPYLASQIAATDVVTGERRGYQFLIFTYRDMDKSEQAAFRVTLPIGLPFMWVNGSSEFPFSSDTDRGVQAWLAQKLGIVPVKNGASPMRFWAQDNRLVRVVSVQSRPGKIADQLDATVNLAERLMKAARETVAEAEARKA
ncbi:hypothetical protein [Actinoplanes sp. NPDC051494]|uniref:hypothetical protein n=1 Tax=Actinoplanes sp. NPDC051494 TaxID=3363907 RepID=UPI0037AA4F6C